MRLKSVVVAAATCLLLFSPIANAQPAMIDGGRKDFHADDLTCRIDIFNEGDIADFVAASSVTVYRADEVLDPDEYEELCSASDASRAVLRLRAAIKADSAASQWFSDNGIDIDTVILMVDNADDTFDLYLN